MDRRGGCNTTIVRVGATSLFIILLTLLFATTTYAAAPVANFTTNVTSGYAPLTVAFYDNSTNEPTGWMWDFAFDGSTVTVDGMERNETWTYTEAGNYTIYFVSSNDDGSSEALIATDYITVLAVPVAASESPFKLGVVAAFWAIIILLFFVTIMLMFAGVALSAIMALTGQKGNYSLVPVNGQGIIQIVMYLFAGLVLIMIVGGIASVLYLSLF